MKFKQLKKEIFVTILGLLTCVDSFSQTAKFGPRVQNSKGLGSFSKATASPHLNAKAQEILLKLNSQNKINWNQKKDLESLSFGGATSGGGSDVGVEVKLTIEQIVGLISSSGSELYGQHSQRIIELAEEVKIYVVDQELEVQSSEGKIQKSSAFSYSDSDSDGALIFINRQDWISNLDILSQERLIHHELMVLAGLEKTAEYHLTAEFVKMRTQFWHQLRAQGFVCTFTAFSKIEKSGRGLTVGKLLGSSAFSVLNANSAQGGFEIVADLSASQKPPLSRHGILFRFVISDEGYLRGQFGLAYFESRESSNSQFPVWKTFADFVPLHTESIFYTPYDLIKDLRTPTLIDLGQYYGQVNCVKM